MALGEFVVEIVVRCFLECVLPGFFYGSGYLLLKAVTFGRLRLAPLGSIGEKNRADAKWYQEWTPWLRRRQRPKALKAEYTCLAGILAWLLVAALAWR